MQVSGHHGIVAGIFYIIAQLSGACFGILLLVIYRLVLLHLHAGVNAAAAVICLQSLAVAIYARRC